MRLLLAILLAIPAASAISLECPTTVPCCTAEGSIEDVVRVPDIAYGTAYHKVDADYETLLLDAFTLNRTEHVTLPVVVMVHGGGYLHEPPQYAGGTSNKAMTKMLLEASAFAQHGFLALSIEYRRYRAANDDPISDADTVIHPVEDVKTAVRFVRSNPNFLRERWYNVTADVDNIVVYGCSAGGVTVSHAYLTDTDAVASNYSSIGNHSNFSSSVKAVISGSGGLVQKSLWNPPVLPCASIPPYLTIINIPDENDLIGSAAEYTDTLMRELGVVTEIITLGQGHCPTYINPDSPTNEGAKVIVDMVSWFLRFLTVPGCRLPNVPAGGDTGCVFDPFNETLLANAFRQVFPVEDGSEVLVGESVFAQEAENHLEVLGVPTTPKEFRELSEESLLEVIMKASLGNLVLDPDPDAEGKVQQPYQANPLTGKIEYVDNFQTSRIAIFQVLVLSLLLALARSWFLLENAKKKGD